RQGIRVFWKQPIAMSGLFFLFMAIMSLSALLPIVGSFIALTLLPAATLGLMAASREVDPGKFPMPSILAIAFRASKERKRDMAILGLLYALGFVGVMGISALMDGGGFAKLYLVGGKLDAETIMDPNFQNAMWLSLLLYMPLSMVFWHAPALVHWHGVPALKSLFFSTVACLRNWRAFLVFGLMWTVVFMSTALILSLVSGLMGDGELVSMTLLPAMLMLAAMFFCSVYFSFRDCFVSDTIYA
ncbi:MAG: BPSS1780 family membrane protein, partial [Burkholderiales bacterium]|nr:BPSS1780 family membrane protein [Burkholderiales bacterium]